MANKAPGESVVDWILIGLVAFGGTAGFIGAFLEPFNPRLTFFGAVALAAGVWTLDRRNRGV